jgi:hypothetical protein
MIQEATRLEGRHDGAARSSPTAPARLRLLRKVLWYRAKFLADRVRGRSTGISPRQVFWISPHAIESMLSPRLDDEAVRGRIVPAQWDLALHPVAQLPTFAGLRQRVVDGCRWEDTILHPRNFDASADVPREVQRFRTMTEGGFHAWSRSIDELCESLETRGWQEARALGAPFFHNLSVAVTRDGVLVRARSGLHRLILAQLLDLPRIPVVLFCLHKDFPGRRAEVLEIMRAAA